MDIKLYEEFVNNYVIGSLKAEFQGVKPEDSILVNALDYTRGSDDTLIKVKVGEMVYNIPKNLIFIDPSMSI